MIKMTRYYQHDDLSIRVTYTNEDMTADDCDGMTEVGFSVEVAITDRNGSIYYGEGYTEWEPNDENDAPCYESVEPIIDDVKEGMRDDER